MSNNQDLEERIEKSLFDSIVAVGVREEGTVRDLDTLIIDRRKAVEALSGVVLQEKIELLEALKKSYEYDELDAEMMDSLILSKIEALKGTIEQ